MPIDKTSIAWGAPSIDPSSITWDEPKGAKSKAYQEGRKVSNPIARGLASVINGPLMGFGDEVLGGIGGVYDTITKGGSLSDNYTGNRDHVRGIQDQYKEDFPIGSAVTQMAASAPMLAVNALAPVMTAAKAIPVVNTVANGTSMLARAAQAAGTGATYGAVQGAGDSTADSLGGVAADSGKNALLSAALGGVGVPVAGVVGAVGGNIRQRVSNSPATQALAEKYAQYKIAQAAARDATDTGRMGARLSTLGDEARVVDAGGASTRSLLDTLAILPGKTKEQVEQAIHQRQAGRGSRMISSAEQNLNAQGQRLAPNLQAWDEARATAAAPLYTQLRTVDVPPTDNLRSIVQAADDLGALVEARAISTANRQPFSISPTNPNDWNMGQLDHVKQGLDQLIAKQWDAAAGKYTPKGASYQGLKAALVSELDNLTTNPQTGQVLYREARNAYAGPSAIIDAAQQGRNAITKDGATITGLTANLSDSEKQAFRLGAFEALRNKLGTQGGQTNIINMWKEPATQEKLKAIFGDERSYRQFAADVAKEGRLKGLESVGRGSQTAQRQFAAGDLDSGAATDAASMVANAKAGNLWGAGSAAKNLWNKVSTPESVRNQMGSILLSKGQQGQQNVNSLAAILQEMNNRNQSIATGSGLIGSRLAAPITY